jgi:hypothetical protein
VQRRALACSCSAARTRRAARAQLARPSVVKVRIALRLAGYEPRLAAGAKLSGGGHAALMEALLPEELRPGKRDCRLSLERCVSVMLGGGVPEDRVLTAVVNKTNAAGVLTQNAWQVRLLRACSGGGLRACAKRRWSGCCNQ